MSDNKREAILSTEIKIKTSASANELGFGHEVQKMAADKNNLDPTTGRTVHKSFEMLSKAHIPDPLPDTLGGLGRDFGNVTDIPLGQTPKIRHKTIFIF